MTTTTSSTGCGCGGARSGAGCTCGSCAPCENDGGGFLRPRFFAGQLLTEDDLQQLVDYVVGKRRLHNRTIVGDGVACGLEVHCDPCDRRSIIVRPGHAIDCCGNDIVVPCEHTLDINELVRELRARLGRDCGDPCDDADQPTPTPDGEAAGGAGADDDRDDGPKLRVPARRYYLYVRYCETDVDPVMAYTTDEPCGVNACQPTRVREGYKFELRCDAGDREEIDILDRLCACLCDPGKVADHADEMGEVEEVATKLKAHLAALAQPVAEVSAAGTATPIAMAYALPATIDWSDEIHKVRLREDEAVLAETLPGEDEEVVAWDEARVIKAARAMNAVGASLGRFALSQVRARTGREDTRVRRAVASAAKLEAAAVFSRARDVITPELIVEHVKSPVVRAELLSAREFADEIELGGDDSTTTFERLTTTKGLAYISGVQVSGAALSSYGQALLRMEQCLQSWLLTSPTCAARDLIQRLRVAEDITSTEVSTKRLRGFVATQQSLASALRQVVYECVCAALNPPCRPCDDPAVLLASVDVRECEVASTCGTVRKWIISGPNVRYWFPEIGELGGMLEALCCTGGACGDGDSLPARKAIAFASKAVAVGPLALLLKSLGKRGDGRDDDRTNCARALGALVGGKLVATGQLVGSFGVLGGG